MQKRTQKHLKQKKTVLSGSFILGLLFLIVLITVFLSVFPFVWNRFWYTEVMPGFLPAKNTIAFLEINVDSSSPEQQNLMLFDQNNQLFKVNQMIEIIDQNLSITERIKPLIAGRIGVAVLNGSVDQSKLFPVLIIKYSDHKQLADFLLSSELNVGEEDLKEEKVEGAKLYHFDLGQNYLILEYSGYLFFAEDKEPLLSIIKARQGQTATLSKNADYQQIAQALPKQNLAFAYINLQKGLDSLMQNHDWLAEKFPDLINFFPLIKSYKATGLSFNVKENRLTVKQISSIDREYLKGDYLQRFTKQYYGDLQLMMPTKPLVLFGGRDFKTEYQRLKEIYSKFSEQGEGIFKGIFEKQKDLFIGEALDFESDYLPLLSDEYLFALAGDPVDPVYVFMLKLQSPDADFVRMEKIIDAYKPKIASLYPVKKEVELPDGTKGEEFVSDPSVINSTSAKHSGIDYKYLQVGDSKNEFGLAYGLVGDTFVMSTNKNYFESIIDQKGLLTSKDQWKFSELNHPDEYASFDLGKYFRKGELKVEYAKKYQDYTILGAYSINLN